MVGFGSTFAEAIMFPVALRTNVRHLPYVHRLQLAINQWLASPALLVVLATGFYQVSDRDFDLGDFWLSATLTIVVVIIRAARRVLHPGRSQARPDGGGGDRRRRRP